MSIDYFYILKRQLEMLLRRRFTTSSYEDISDAFGHSIMKFLLNDYVIKRKNNYNVAIKYLYKSAKNYLLDLKEEKKNLISLEKFLSSQTGEYSVNASLLGGGRIINRK